MQLSLQVKFMSNYCLFASNKDNGGLFFVKEQT
jgi:hypothetical protein